jgi:hypothetical protein
MEKLVTNIFKIFCFFDEEKLVVLANWFQKKTQKTPGQEITKALKIKEKYYFLAKCHSQAMCQMALCAGLWHSPCIYMHVLNYLSLLNTKALIISEK